MSQSVGDSDILQKRGPEMVPEEGGSTVEGRSLWRIALMRLRKDKVALFGGGIVVFFILIALLADLICLIAGVDPYKFDGNALTSAGLPKGFFGGASADHWLGAEPQTGRDVMARLLYGIRTSLLVAVIATAVALAVGVIAGIAAGYFGGWVDAVISRVVDILLGFPQLLFLIALTPLIADRMRGTFGVDSSAPEWRGLILVVLIAFFGWPYFTRVIRSQVLSLREREFVDAARIVGASSGHILFKQMLPNLWATIIVFASLQVPVYVGLEASLAYLGVGFVPPTASLGVTLNDAVQWATAVPSYFFLPGVTLIVIVLGFNLFGDGLRDALDPKSTR